MLSWCFGMVESFVICGCYKYTLLASTEFNLTVPVHEISGTGQIHLSWESIWQSAVSIAISTSK
jgi:hypothetical protein